MFPANLNPLYYFSHYLYSTEQAHIYKQFYYNTSSSGISDACYDSIEKGLEHIDIQCPDYKEYMESNYNIPSITNIVGAHKKYDYVTKEYKDPEKLIKHLWDTKYKQLHKQETKYHELSSNTIER